MKKTFLIFFIIIAGGTIMVSSCKVSKDVAAPKDVFPVTYRELTADTTSIAKMPWTTFFSDPELNAIISAAIQHNNDLQVAVKDIEAAELSLKQAKLGNIPSVSIAATSSTSRPSDNSLNGISLSAFDFTSKHIEDYTLAASLSWEADIWGKIKSQKAGALAFFLQSEEARKVVQTRIVSDVAKGYYNLLMLDAQLMIAKRNVSLNDSTLQILKLQYDAGQVTSLAVQQAQAQELLAAALIPNFEKQINIQENAISILSGVNPAAIQRHVELANVAVSKSFAVGLPVDLLSRRPDVRLAELNVDRANTNVGYAKANMYPSLSITAQGGLDAIKASNWFNIPASLFGTVIGSVAQPLFDKKKLYTQYKIAQLKRDETVINFRQSLLVAVGEVSDNLIKLEKLDRQRVLVGQRVITLQAATQNAHQLFSYGLANYLEVITAQGNVLQSQLEQAAVKKDQLDAQVDLYRSVGGGWQ